MQYMEFSGTYKGYNDHNGTHKHYMDYIDWIGIDYILGCPPSQ